jgi:DNA-binding XRE family transcriptional regulator
MNVAELLRAKRGTGTKADMSRLLGVSRQTYGAWEFGLYVPGDEYAATLAEVLDLDLREVVWLLYLDRTQAARNRSE